MHKTYMYTYRLDVKQNIVGIVLLGHLAKKVRKRHRMKKKILIIPIISTFSKYLVKVNESLDTAKILLVTAFVMHDYSLRYQEKKQKNLWVRKETYMKVSKGKVPKQTRW